jgi:hypothetical protein
MSVLAMLKHDFWGTPTNSTLSHKSFRPLCSLFFRVLWRVRTSDNPAFVFHLAQVVLNAIGSALAVLLIIGPFCSDSPLTRIVASLLYATHPIKTEAVAGVVGTAGRFFLLIVYILNIMSRNTFSLVFLWRCLYLCAKAIACIVWVVLLSGEHVQGNGCDCRTCSCSAGLFKEALFRECCVCGNCWLVVCCNSSYRIWT